MEYLHNGFTLELCDGGFPLSTDSVALAGFVKLPKSACVLDLGAGCGTLGLLLCASDPGCSVTGIELSEDAHNAALKNAERNGISHRLTSICGDIRSIPEFLAPGSFHTCVSNPPYFTGGPVSADNGQARHTHQCTSEDLFRSAGWALKWGGDFYIVHKPESLGELCGRAAKYQLQPKELTLVRHDITKPVSLILLKFRNGAKPGLMWKELLLHTPTGEPTEQYRAIYHL